MIQTILCVDSIIVLYSLARSLIPFTRQNIIKIPIKIEQSLSLLNHVKSIHVSDSMLVFSISYRKRFQILIEYMMEVESFLSICKPGQD